MSNYDIKVDLSPYLPDTYLKEKIYQSMDKVDYTTYIGMNSTIFCFNTAKILCAAMPSP